VPVEGLQQHSGGSGKMADAVLHRAVGVQQLRAAGSDRGILVHVLGQRSKGIAGQQGIAIQEAGISRPRHAHSEIVVSDIELVGLVPHENDAGKNCGHHVGALVG
jgi:hypothetical protein